MPRFHHRYLLRIRTKYLISQLCGADTAFTTTYDLAAWRLVEITSRLCIESGYLVWCTTPLRLEPTCTHPPCHRGHAPLRHLSTCLLYPFRSTISVPAGPCNMQFHPKQWIYPIQTPILPYKILRVHGPTGTTPAPHPLHPSVPAPLVMSSKHLTLEGNPVP